MFYWKHHFFQASVDDDRTKLRVKWCPAFVNTDDQAQEDQVQDDEKYDNIIPTDTRGYFDSNSNDILIENSPAKSSEFQHKMQSAENLLSSYEIFNFGKKRHIGKTLKSGFSFDCFYPSRVPVILIELENTLTHAKCGDVSVFSRQQSHSFQKNTSANHRKLLLFGITVNTSASSSKTGDGLEKQFLLLPLRLFNLRNQCDIVLHDKCNLRFVSDFGFFYLNNGQHSLSLKLYFGQHNEKSETLVQSFILDEGEARTHSKSNIRILDVFNSYVNKMFLLLIKWTSEESESQCGAFLFYNLYKSKYETKKVQTSLLFPVEIAQIIDTITFSSVVMTKMCPHIKSSSLVMMTTTNYVIKYSQGIMTHCIAMDGSFNISQKITDQMELKMVDYSWNGVLKTAFHVKDKIYLVDWTHEEISVVQTERVLMIAGCENDGLDMKMLLSMTLKSSDRNVEQDLDKWTISVVNICQESNKEKGDEYTMKGLTGTGDNSLNSSSFSSPAEKRHENVEELKLNEATQNVMKGLTFQEKKCLIDLSHLEQSMRCKQVFIHQTVNHFSQLNDEGKTGLKMKHINLPPLVPMVGHTDASAVAFDEDEVTRGYWKVGKLWKRTIDKFLVCGVDLVRLCHSNQLCDIHLVLVPINPCRTTVKSKSQLLHRSLLDPLPLSPSFLSSSTSTSPEPSSPPRKRLCRTNPHHSIRATDGANEMTPAKVTVAAYLDTRDLWGCEDVNVQVCLKYSLLEIRDSGNIVKHFHKLNCGIVSITQEEKLEELCSLRSQMKKCKSEDFLTAEDMTALDCVQNSIDLQVSSVLSPVTSLLQKVKGHPSITYLPRSDQCIYTADHRLQFCRIKWLKHLEKSRALIRIYSSSQDDLLLFIEFLHSLSPPDITFHLHDSSSTEKTEIKSLNEITKWLSDNVEQSISQINKDLENMSVSEKKGDDDVEIIENVSSSPKFHSSVQKMESKSKQEINKSDIEAEAESVSGSVVPVTSKMCESDKRTPSSCTTSVDDDLIQFDFGSEFSSKTGVGSKNKKGLGGKKSVKSKLTMKKK